MEIIEYRNLIGTVVGGAALMVGKKGLALYINGINQVVDFSYQGNTCFGALSLCAHGWVTTFWLKLPTTLMEES